MKALMGRVIVEVEVPRRVGESEQAAEVARAGDRAGTRSARRRQRQNRMQPIAPCRKAMRRAGLCEQAGVTARQRFPSRDAVHHGAASLFFVARPGGGTGRHAVLRGQCREASRFESEPGHPRTGYAGCESPQPVFFTPLSQTASPPVHGPCALLPRDSGVGP